VSTLADEGFLSDEVEAVVQTVRSRYSAWLSQLYAVNKLLVQEQYSFRVNLTSARELTCASLYMRALTHCQAAVLLIERGMDASARVMIRCALEALFSLGACARDYATAVAFLDADQFERKRRMKYLQQLQEPELQEIAANPKVAKIIADSQQQIDDLDVREIKVREMAKLAGLEDLYLTGYASLCGAVHSSARDLEQHFEFDDAGNVKSMVNEPAINDLAKPCLAVGETMISILQTVAPVFRLQVNGACETHMATLRGLYQEATGR
jgi:hypothetical protein